MHSGKTRYSSAEKKACRTNAVTIIYLQLCYHLATERNAKRKRVEGENGIDSGSSRLNLVPDSNTQNDAETMRAFALSAMKQEPNEGDATATRASIRAANLRAAAALKGKLMDDAPPSDQASVVLVEIPNEASTVSVVVKDSTSNGDDEADMDVEDDEEPAPSMVEMGEPPGILAEADPSMEASEKETKGEGVAAPRGLKRKHDEIEDEESSSDDAAEESGKLLALKVNPDGSVEQVDSVRYVQYLSAPSTLLPI